MSLIVAFRKGFLRQLPTGLCCFIHNGSLRPRGREGGILGMRGSLAGRELWCFSTVSYPLATQLAFSLPHQMEILKDKQHPMASGY